MDAVGAGVSSRCFDEIRSASHYVRLYPTIHRNTQDGARMERSEPAEIDLVELWSGPIATIEPMQATRTTAEVLVDRVIADELAALRDAFSQGAEFAVTRMESPRHRMMHRLECQSLEKVLDRHAQWSELHRKRLVDDPNYRLPLPTLVTREAALGLAAIRSCRICWPNLHGLGPRPLRKLRAGGLRAHHVGHMLSAADGTSLGTIVSATTRVQTNLFGVEQAAVEVVTSSRTLHFAPSEQVFIWDLPTDDVALERKMQLLERLGQG
jgi:hypothetical protein